MEESASSSAPARGQRKRPREAAAAAGSVGDAEREAYKRILGAMRDHAAWDPFTYLSIADALKLKAPGDKRNPIVCIFAVVSTIGAAVHSLGTDFTVTLKIMDGSHKTAISATFFAPNPDLLPRVKSSGDVISLHNVVVTEHCGEPFITFDKKISSFALFDSRVPECSPYQISMMIKYDHGKRDKELLTKMRTWLLNNPTDLKDLGLQLSGLKSDSTFDLVCKVLHVHEGSGKLIFYVWDGTDTPTAELQAISDAEAVKSPPLPQGPPLPRNVLRTMPCVGTVLRIFSDSSVKKVPKEVKHMKEGIYWARFRNISCTQESGIWKGIFSASSGVSLLSHEDGSVVGRLKMYDRRKANRVHCRPMASIPSNVADVDHKDVGYSTLMDSLTHHEVTHKLKTLVRVVAAYHRENSDSIRLILEDSTARIRAYVRNDEKVKFFGGFLTKEMETKKMNKVLGIPEPEDSAEAAPITRNPPWIWCRLKSYYLDKNDRWGSRRYKVYDTTIRD